MGAWIETLPIPINSNIRLVAPHMGAWIETNAIKSIGSMAMSHPIWVRGLKLRRSV